MTKTLKQIADELEIDKQRVYRFVKKNHIAAALKSGQVMWYDEVAETLIKKEFLGADFALPNQNHIKNDTDDMVFEQLKFKDLQIENLQKALESSFQLLDQEQQLHAQTKNELSQLVEHNQQLLEYKSTQESKGFWARLFNS